MTYPKLKLQLFADTPPVDPLVEQYLDLPKDEDQDSIEDTDPTNDPEQNQDTPKDPEQDPDKDEDKDKAPDQDDNTVPEKYTFELPEGFSLDEESNAEISALFKESNLTQAQANKLVNCHIKMMEQTQRVQREAYDKAVAQWQDKSKKDPEFGGANLKANLEIAKRGLKTYGSDELRDILSHYNLGDHPELIRLFYKLGKNVKEDSMVEGGEQPKDTKSLGQIFYGDQKM